MTDAVIIEVWLSGLEKKRGSPGRNRSIVWADGDFTVGLFFARSYSPWPTISTDSPEASMRLTLRTLLAYIDDTLPAAEAAEIGRKVAESDSAPGLIEKIRKLTRKRSLIVPSGNESGSPSDPNTVAEYLSNSLPPDMVTDFESICLESNVHLAEAAACHQILTLLLSDPVRVPPTARKRMYDLVKGSESLPNRRSGTVVPVGGFLPAAVEPSNDDQDASLLLGLPIAGRTRARWVIAVCLAIIAMLAFMISRPEPYSKSTSASIEHDANKHVESTSP
jgi:hypothetical protein